MPLQRRTAQAVDSETLATRLSSGLAPEIVVDGVGAGLDAVPCTTVSGSASLLGGLGGNGDGGIQQRD